MDKEEIKRLIVSRIDRDEDFSKQLESALEVGAWQIIAEMIADVVGYVIDKASEFWAWLKREFL